MLRKALFVVAAAAMLTACGSKEAAKTDVDSAAVPVEGVVVEETVETPDGVATEAEGVVEEAAPAAKSDVNALIDEFEATGDKLAALMAKVKKGDVSAASELQTVTAKFQSLSQQIGNQASNMTPEQAKRFAEVAQKVADKVK